MPGATTTVPFAPIEEKGRDRDSKEAVPSTDLGGVALTTSQEYRWLEPLTYLKLLWDFTESNFGTFVVPNTAFGIFGALAGATLIDGPVPSALQILARLPVVLLFNWYTVFLFDLANQRSPQSVQEDLLNKPWRPIPQGKISTRQTQTLMLITVPMILVFDYILDVWHEGLMIHILIWLYNDLGGGDMLVRDPIIALAYGLFNCASLRLAAGPGTMPNSLGLQWIALVSAIILTTMQVQDLKDQAGDRSRQRQTIPLVWGDGVSRKIIALCVPLWSLLCFQLWQLRPLLAVPSLAMGAYTAYRAIRLRGADADARTWKMWCLWTATIYLVPVLNRLPA